MSPVDAGGSARGPAAVLFDLDGTLVSSGGAGARALDRAFLDVLGIREALDGRRLAGMTDWRITQGAIRAATGREALDDEVARVIDRYVANLPGEVEAAARAEAGAADGRSDRPRRYRVLDGVRQLIEALRARGVATGLATGNVEAGARAKLAPSGLNPLLPFGGFCSATDADRPSIVRAGVRRAAEAAAMKVGGPVAPADVWVIGDTVYDVAAARAVGCPTVAVATGPDPAEALAAAGADVVVATLAEAPAILRAMGLDAA